MRAGNGLRAAILAAAWTLRRVSISKNQVKMRESDEVEEYARAEGRDIT
jgi:hypothetical protein